MTDPTNFPMPNLKRIGDAAETAVAPVTAEQILAGSPHSARTGLVRNSWMMPVGLAAAAITLVALLGISFLDTDDAMVVTTTQPTVVATPENEDASAGLAATAPTATSTPVPTATSEPTVMPTVATAPTSTLSPSSTSVPSAVPVPTSAPLATPTPVPNAAPEPTSVRLATPTPGQTAAPVPTSVPLATPTPVPNAAPVPTSMPLATPTPGPTAAPVPTSVPLATPTPGPTAAPVPTSVPLATPTPVPTAAPVATSTPISTATPIPTATAIPNCPAGWTGPIDGQCTLQVLAEPSSALPTYSCPDGYSAAYQDESMCWVSVPDPGWQCPPGYFGSVTGPGDTCLADDGVSPPTTSVLPTCVSSATIVPGGELKVNPMTCSVSVPAIVTQNPTSLTCPEGSAGNPTDQDPYCTQIETVPAA